MAVHQRRHKIIEFDVEGAEYACQIKTWNLENNTDDGDLVYTLCPDGVFREETDADWALTLEYFSDWRSEGISDFFMAHDGETVNFQIDHHPDIPAEHVRWVGQCVVKAPTVGGEARETEEQEAEFQCVGKPEYSRP